ncbi:DMT family transporter [Halobaculum sp. MBLA0147]|uniref:DMT family transporter n=1 Tax=Halobaculum sp. MBLA0147 TaxID=3079934 RepID=UPI003525F0D9
MSRYRDAGLFLALAAAWGTAFVAIKAGLGTPTAPAGFFETPVLFAALRFDLAGLLMLGYAAVVASDPIPRGRRAWAAVGVGAVLIIAGYHALLFVGETDPAVTSAAAAVIVSLNPVLTTGFSRLLLPEESLGLVGAGGLLVGLLGAVVLANPDPSALLSGGAVAKGLVFAAVTAFALGSVVTERLDAGVEIETVEAWSMVLGAALLHLAAVGLGESPGDVRWTATALGALGFLAVVASAGGFLIYFTLLDRLGSVEINLVSYVVPPFAAVTGWLLLGETPTVATWAGFGLVVVGFGLLKRRVLRAEVKRLRGRGVGPGD